MPRGALPAARSLPREAPFWGPNSAGASRKRVITSQATSTSTPRSDQESASSAPRPPSTVAEPPTPTMMRLQPWSSAAAISSPVPNVVAVSGSLRSTSASPLARAISTIPVPSSSAAHSASTGRPSGPVTVAVRRVPGSEPRSASSVPSPPSASGSARASRPARATPRHIAAAASLGGQAAAELVGAAEDHTRLRQRANTSSIAARSRCGTSTCRRSPARTTVLPRGGIDCLPRSTRAMRALRGRPSSRT